MTTVLVFVVVQLLAGVVGFLGGKGIRRMIDRRRAAGKGRLLGASVPVYPCGLHIPIGHISERALFLTNAGSAYERVSSRSFPPGALCYALERDIRRLLPPPEEMEAGGQAVAKTVNPGVGGKPPDPGSALAASLLEDAAAALNDLNCPVYDTNERIRWWAPRLRDKLNAYMKATRPASSD